MHHGFGVYVVYCPPSSAQQQEKLLLFRITEENNASLVHQSVQKLNLKLVLNCGEFASIFQITLEVT